MLEDVLVVGTGCPHCVDGFELLLPLPVLDIAQGLLEHLVSLSVVISDRLQALNGQVLRLFLPDQPLASCLLCVPQVLLGKVL